MARRGWPAAPAALGLAAALVACSGRIWVDQQSPQTIRLRWYTSEASIEEATEKANRHCQNWDKQAVLLEEFTDQDVTVARFACR